MTLTASFRLPRASARWFVDLVNEQLFWLSSRGLVPAMVSTEPEAEAPG